MNRFFLVCALGLSAHAAALPQTAYVPAPGTVDHFKANPHLIEPALLKCQKKTPSTDELNACANAQLLARAAQSPGRVADTYKTYHDTQYARQLEQRLPQFTGALNAGSALSASAYLGVELPQARQMLNWSNEYGPVHFASAGQLEAANVPQGLEVKVPLSFRMGPHHCVTADFVLQLDRSGREQSGRLAELTLAQCR